MPGADKTVKVTLIAVTDQYVKSTGIASAATSTLGKNVDGISTKSRAMESTLGKSSGAMKALAVSAGALAGTAVVSFLRDSIQAASDLNETVSKTEQVFGKDAMPALQKFGDEAAEALGMSKRQALDAADTFGVFGKAAGKTGKDLVDFSVDATQLAADLSSFHNTTPEEAITALGAALRGESEPIRRYGVLLDDASLRQQALKIGLISTTKDALTPQQKSLAAYQVILQQTADAQGDFSRTSDGLANQQRILAAEWGNAKAKLGEALLPAMTQFVSLLNAGIGPLTATVSAFGAIPGPVKAAAAAIVAMRLAQAGFAKIDAAGMYRSVAEALSSAGQAATLAGGGFKGAMAGVSTFTRGMGSIKGAASGLLGILGGPWGLAIGGATMALTSWMQGQQEAKAATQSLTDTLDKQTGAFSESTAAALIAQLQDAVDPATWERAASSMDAAGVSMADFISAYREGGQTADDFWERLLAWQDEQIGKQSDINSVTGDIIGAYEEIGQRVENAGTAARVAAAANEELDGSQQASADSGQAMATKLSAQAEAATDAKDALQKLAAEIRSYGGEARDAAAAESDYQQAIDDAAAAVEENGKTLDLNSEAGRKNAAALRTLAQASLDSAAATMEAGGSQDATRAKVRTARDEFIRQATQMGMTGAAAKALADKYGLIPAKVSTTVTANTADAYARIGTYLAKINSIPAERVTRFTSITTEILDRRGYATGGYIAGPGTGTSDSIPAYVSDGEYVVKAAAVAKYGTPFFDRLNAMHFASGGPVSSGPSFDYDRMAGAMGPGLDYERLGRALADVLAPAVAQGAWAGTSGGMAVQTAAIRRGRR